MRMRKLKLFPKTFFYTVSIIMLILLIAHGLMYYLLPTLYLNEKKVEIIDKSSELAATLAPLDETAAIQYAEEYAILHNVNITLEIDGDTKRFQGFTPLDIYLAPTISDDEVITNPPTHRTIEKDTPQIFIERHSFQLADQTDVTMFFMLNIQPIDETKQIALKVLPYSFAISFIIALLAAYLYSSRLTKPIKQMAVVTRNMEQLKKDQYIDITTKDEIGMLGENINLLYDTLWHTIDSLETKVGEMSQVEKQKVEFLRAASHELKTPLTSLSIILENMKYNIGKYADRDHYLGEAEKMVQESTTLVQNILSTTKLLTTAEMNYVEFCHVNEIVLQTLEAHDILAKAKHLKVNVQIDADVSVTMNLEALRKVISNLIANAIQYTDEGERVWLTLNEQQLVIENECKPLTDHELEQVFQPFYRPDFSRNKKDGGTGLGLHIVKDILTYANLPFTFTKSEYGMKFTIFFTHVDE